MNLHNFKASSIHSHCCSKVICLCALSREKDSLFLEDDNIIQRLHNFSLKVSKIIPSMPANNTRWKKKKNRKTKHKPGIEDWLNYKKNRKDECGWVTLSDQPLNLNHMDLKK